MPELQSIYYALAPLYPAAVNRDDVVVRQPGAVPPFTPVAQVRSYQGVDVDVWARRFLTDLDRVLAPPVWTALRAESALAEAVAQLTAAREVLVVRISDGLKNLSPVAAVDTEGLARARALLARQLDVSLAEGYATSLIVRRENAIAPWIVSAPAVPTVSPRGTAVATSVLFDPVTDAVTATLAVREAGASPVPFSLNVLVEAPGSESSRPAFDPSSLPVPLRSVPKPLNLVAQEAHAPDLATLTLADAARWSYRLTYTHAPVWQDEMRLAVGFNDTSAVAPAPEPVDDASAGGSGEDLFMALAGYLEVADALAAALPLRVMSEVGLSEAQCAVVGLFADTTRLIAQRWNIRDQTTIPTEEIAAGRVVSFGVHVTHRLSEAGQLCLDTVTLTCSAGHDGDALPGWPVIAVIDADNKPVLLARGEPSGSVAEYRVAPDVQLEGSPSYTFRFEWAGLNIATFRDASAQLIVRRNATLAGSDEPRVSDVFCLSTPTVAATTAITPLIVREGEFPMEGASLGQALAAAIKTLFADAEDLLVSFTLAYRYPLNTPELSELQRVSIPVLILPPQWLDEAVFIGLEAAAGQWLATGRPQQTGAEWAVSLTLFTSAGVAPRPLLTLSQLVLPVVAPAVA